MTFKERYLRGDCSIHVINDWVEIWRASGLDQKRLPEVLGLSENAYRLGLLDLQDVEKDHFIWFEDVGNASLDPLLGRLVQREVDSNHADDYGVWVICKDGRLSAREVV